MSLNWTSLAYIGFGQSGGRSGNGDIILSLNPTPINTIEVDITEEDFEVDMSNLEDERMFTIYLQPQEYTFVVKEQEQDP